MKSGASRRSWSRRSSERVCGVCFGSAGTLPGLVQGFQVPCAPVLLAADHWRPWAGMGQVAHYRVGVAIYVYRCVSCFAVADLAFPRTPNPEPHCPAEELEKAVEAYKARLEEHQSRLKKDQLREAVRKEHHLEGLVEQVVQVSRGGSLRHCV